MNIRRYKERKKVTVRRKPPIRAGFGATYVSSLGYGYGLYNSDYCEDSYTGKGSGMYGQTIGFFADKGVGFGACLGMSGFEGLAYGVVNISGGGGKKLFAI